MQTWLAAFIVIAAVAIVMQAAILVAMFFQVRETTRQMTRIAQDLQMRVDPILVRVNRILDDSQDRISSIMRDAAEMTHIARGQAQKVDRVFTEAVERLRVQVVRADQIVTGALEVIEDTGTRVRRTLWGPVRKASAFLQGLKVGLDFIRSGQRRSQERSTTQDEELFI
jgi:hypothetical protein